VAEVKLLLIVGEPASGKTTLVTALTENVPYSVVDKPFRHTLDYDSHNLEPDAVPRMAVQLGWRLEAGPLAEFSGTDRLAWGVNRAARRFMKDYGYENVLAEGDRLTNTRFINGAIDAGYMLELVTVAVPPDVLMERRRHREQDEAWARGRASKVRGIVETYSWAHRGAIDGSAPTDVALRQLCRISEVASAIVSMKVTDGTTGDPHQDEDHSGGAGAEEG
jgi:chloramphenicol 3-O-phosphotransferase